MNHRVVPILDGLRWEPNAPDESFAYDEKDGLAALVLRAHPDDPDPSSVVIMWGEVEAASFGPPNDEGRHRHALYDAGLGNLLWAGEVVDDGDRREEVRQFLVPTKEGLAEVRARHINFARLPGVVDARTAIQRLNPATASEPRYPEATVDGFTIGMFVSYGDCGDAWVKAPDGGIATLIWETGEPAYCRESIPPDAAGRWGTYAVQVDLPMTTDDEAAGYLRALLPELIPRWRSWARSR